jgi:hypothetical protein
MKILILTLALLTATSALATKGRGGGVGFKCGEKIYLADTYESIVGDRQYYEDKFRDHSIDSLVEESIKRAPIFNSMVTQAFADANENKRNAARVSFKTKYFDEEKLRKALDGMEFTAVKEVPYIGDDQIIDIPKGCIKVPIAYQLIDQKVVLYNKFYYSKLTKFEKAYLVLHELMINIENGTMDTTPVRDTVSIFSDMKSLELKLVDKYNACSMAKYVRRGGWIALRDTYRIFYNVEPEVRNGRIVGFLDSKNGINNELSDYIKKEDLEAFIEHSYAYMYNKSSLKDRKDPNKIFVGKNIYRRDIERYAYMSSAKYYSLQAKETGYAKVLRKHYAEMSVCEYIILVDKAFIEQAAHKKGRLAYERTYKKNKK